MEELDTPHPEDHGPTAQERSQDEIYDSLTSPSEQDDGPFIAASGLQDSSPLRLLLQRVQLLNDEEDRRDVLNQNLNPWVGGLRKWPSPLLRAIERQRPENIRLLLDHGADPNGVDIAEQRHLARLVRRFWAYGKGMIDSYHYILQDGGYVYVNDVSKVSADYVPLTEAELAKRRSRVAAFWTEPHKTGLDYSLDQQLLHSVVRAATSSPEILDQVLDSGADASLWLEPDIIDQLPDEEQLSSSALALSTPLHAAISNNNLDMLRALLNRSFNPNSRAFITGSLALTPCQYAIIIGDLEAYSILTAHDKADPGILTPIFNVHILHFATALLREDLLQAIQLPLSSAPATALGHTLLHVACLPRCGTEVRTSEKVEQSIHDFRSLHGTSLNEQLPRRKQFDSDGKQLPRQSLYDDDGHVIPVVKERDVPEELRRQQEVCKLIISELGTEQIGLKDIHGNTALHYLAGAWDPNESLVSWMRAQSNAEWVWQNAENMWGHTPRALWDDNWAERAMPPLGPFSISGRPGWPGRGHHQAGWPRS